MAISVRLLAASHGDSFLISHTSGASVYNILIDGGPQKTFAFGPNRRHSGELRIVLDEIKARGQTIDLAILTHVDSDHISGLIEGFKVEGYLKELTKRIWFNSSNTITEHFNHIDIVENHITGSFDDSPKTSINQGKTFEELLIDLGCWRRTIIKSGDKYREGPFTFTILSPCEDDLKELLCIWPDDTQSAQTAGPIKDHSLSFKDLLEDDKFKEDGSITNGSSIAFILEADNKCMVFLGDAYCKTIVKGLRSLGFSKEKKLKADFVKVSHHGSQYNTNDELLDLISTENFLISTDGSVHGHPDKRTIARIFNSNKKNVVHVNYESAIRGLLLPHEIEMYQARLKVINNRIVL